MQKLKPKIEANYPRTVKLDGDNLTLRLMTGDDAERMLQFAQDLPPEDSLFLRMDITKSEGIKQWVNNINDGRTVSVLADINGEIAGYASLHHNEVSWQRHLGEIRLQVSQRHRSRGLGRILASEVFQVARELGLRKVVAQMTPDQKGATATFERLGFQPEALLQDFVIDRGQRTRDLVVMSYDMTGLTDRVD
jgi:RimJ/RimL family protein N-acetyltransferase